MRNIWIKWRNVIIHAVVALPLTIGLLLPVTASPQENGMPPELEPGQTMLHRFVAYCGETYDLLKKNDQIRMGNIGIFNGYSDITEMLTHVLVDREEGTFTVMLHYPNGVLCIISNGNYFDQQESLMAPPRGKDG